jgi:uncharacterized protein (DUF111 family)
LKQQSKVTTQEGQKAKELAIKVERMQEGLKDLSIQEISVPTQEVLRKGILTSKPLRVPQQCEATTLREDKNKNGKKISEIVKETQIQERRQGRSIKRRLIWKIYKKLRKPNGRLRRLEPRRRQVRRV